ncbi:MAG TPA: transcriptional regulator, partial [Noviherbaspirillum sp.]|nr:transcriptional regulator [Noviherbaspirillum sp.]
MILNRLNSADTTLPLTQFSASGESVEERSSRCAACSMHKICLPTGLSEEDMARLDKIIGRRRKVPRDGHLYRVGDPFTNLYAIRLGHFKTHQINPNGDQQ